jgi:hypothetical protein
VLYIHDCGTLLRIMAESAKKAYHQEYNRTHRVKLNEQHAARRQERIPKARPAKGETLDGEYEARHDIRDRVICRICRAVLRQLPEHITSTHPAWSVDRYRAEFPGAPIICVQTREKLSKKGASRRHADRGLWWQIAVRRIRGESNDQIAAAVGLSSEGARHVCARLRLPWCGYDLGSPLTMAHVQEIVDATGLGRRAFGRRFGLPERLVLEIGPWAAARRLQPGHAVIVARARDRIVADVFRASASGGMRRWHVPAASGALAALVPDLGRISRRLRELLSQSRGFLRRNPSATADEWGGWICAPGQLAFLPLAAELAPHIEPRFPMLRARSPRLWEQILADRFGVSCSVVHHAATSKPSDSVEIERFILRSARTAVVAATAKPPRAVKEARRRGRKRVNEAVDLRKAQQLRAEGLSWGRIAQAVDPTGWRQDHKAAKDRIRVGVGRLSPAPDRGDK